MMREADVKRAPYIIARRASSGMRCAMRSKKPQIEAHRKTVTKRTSIQIGSLLKDTILAEWEGGFNMYLLFLLCRVYF